MASIGAARDARTLASEIVARGSSSRVATLCRDFVVAPLRARAATARRAPPLSTLCDGVAFAPPPPKMLQQFLFGRTARTRPEHGADKMYTGQRARAIRTPSLQLRHGEVSRSTASLSTQTGKSPSPTQDRRRRRSSTAAARSDPQVLSWATSCRRPISAGAGRPACGPGYTRGPSPLRRRRAHRALVPQPRCQAPGCLDGTSDTAIAPRCLLLEVHAGRLAAVANGRRHLHGAAAAGTVADGRRHLHGTARRRRRRRRRASRRRRDQVEAQAASRVRIMNFGNCEGTSARAGAR